MASPDDEVQAWLSNLPKKIRKELKSSFREEGEALSQAQSSALVSLEKPPEETGGLEASLRVEDDKDGVSVLVLAGGEKTTKDGYDHALAFEYGTVKQPARSFFFAPYRARQRSIQQNIEDAISDAVDKA